MQSQVNIQTQQQVQRQQQHLSQVQLQTVRLLEMPLAQLEDNVTQELDNNPSLEPDYSEMSSAEGPIMENDRTDEEERRDDALSDALERIGQDDRMEDMSYSDDYVPGARKHTDDDCARPMEDGNMTSFIDTLTDQMNMEDLDEQEKQIMEYLICSLDDDGLLRKDLQTISDELAIYNGLFVEADEIEPVLLKMQEFDPAGIGARTLQECLLIQVERMKASPLTMLMYRVINECYEDFSNNRWQKICKTLSITETQAESLRYEIRHRLNPKPGSALGETQGRSLHQITPDFVVHVDFDSNISFELNNGRVPQLHVVREDEMFLKEMAGAKSKAEREAIAFTQRNVERASTYIEAMRQRSITMTRTMKAIIDLQRPYFLSGDDSDLRPMVLRDVAERTGYDLSTISRVSRSKYVQTPWGTFRLRHFFTDSYTTNEGEVMSTRKIKNALRDVIDSEDKKHPLADDKLVAVMAEKGFPIARRTIAKYREQLGIPVARLRKR